MADLLDHVKQANHNEQCAKLILKTSTLYRDWAITSAFYTAVHLAEACFTTRHDIKPPQGSDLHKFRSDTIRKEAPRAFPIYRELRDACWNVRYLTGKQPWSTYYKASDVQDMVDDKLPKLRTELAKAFGIVRL